MVTITAIAEQKIKELMVEEKDIVGLRVYVKGGGCHGYQYGMAFESKMGDDDTVVEKGERQGHHGFAERAIVAGRRSRLRGQPPRVRVLDQESTSEDDLRLRQLFQRLRNVRWSGASCFVE